jgi:hypothetical protein
VLDRLRLSRALAATGLVKPGQEALYWADQVLWRNRTLDDAKAPPPEVAAARAAQFSLDARREARRRWQARALVDAFVTGAEWGHGQQG